MIKFLEEKQPDGEEAKVSVIVDPALPTLNPTPTEPSLEKSSIESDQDDDWEDCESDEVPRLKKRSKFGKWIKKIRRFMRKFRKSMKPFDHSKIRELFDHLTVKKRDWLVSLLVFGGACVVLYRSVPKMLKSS